MTPLIGFAPDADDLLPGVITDCNNLVPNVKGFESAKTLEPIGIAALPADCIGAAVATKLDSVRRVFSGTAAKLYELVGTTWTDVSRGTSYTSGIDGRWSFCQFGNATLASDRSAKIQRSNISGAFADIATAPIAKIIYSFNSFVIALNINDGTDKPDGWANCASFDDTDWTPSVTTLANSGRLVSTPGRITAGGRLGEYAIAYKENAIYVGQFVGAPATFDWVEVPSVDAGCVGQDAWCSTGTAHFLVGLNNFWLFDGTRPQPLGDGVVRQWFMDNKNPAFADRTQCLFDSNSNRVYVCYCSKNATKPDQALVYHVVTQRWGKMTIDVQSVINYIASGYTIDGLTAVSATIDALPSSSFDSSFWTFGGRAVAFFDSTRQIKLLTGASGNSWFVTGDFGADEQVTSLRKARLRFQDNPTSATLTGLHKMNAGDGFTVGQTVPMTSSKFDIRQTARFHRARFDLVGNYELSAIDAQVVPAGQR